MSKLLLDLDDYKRITGKQWAPPDTKGKAFNSSLYRKNRVRALKKNDGKCVYCGRPATEVDHVLPRSQGGPHSLENLVPCCADCNRRKKGRTPEEWLGND